MRTFFRAAPALLALGAAVGGCAPSSAPVAPAADPASAAATAQPVVIGVDGMS